jgi:hypothetical protein
MLIAMLDEAALLSKVSRHMASLDNIDTLRVYCNEMYASPAEATVKISALEMQPRSQALVSNRHGRDRIGSRGSLDRMRIVNFRRRAIWSDGLSLFTPVFNRIA